MRTVIADVIFRTRDVEVPDKCPHCGASLKNGLTVCRYDYAFYQGNQDGTPTKKDADFDDFPGEAPPLGFFCGECAEEVTVGQEKIIETHNLERVVEDTVWSQSIGRVILGEQA